MYPAERQREIVRIAQRNESRSAAVGALAGTLEVTPETVRRDLAVLERRGLMVRRHGGASLVTRAPFELSLAQRSQQERAEKERIARGVITMLPDDGVVLLDSGSLNYLVAESFPDRDQIVVTNNLAAVPVLERRPRLTVIALPGRVRALTQASVDAWTAEHLEGLHVDAAVLGANGVTSEAGATTTNPEEAEVKSAMLSVARFRILTLTASKIGLESFCRFADLAEFDVMVTDDRMSSDQEAELRTVGAELIVA